MPPINHRMAGFDSILKTHEMVSVPTSSAPPVTGDPAALHVTGNSSNLMSITSGNSVPMRGILPIEQMSDCDLYKFFPYTAFMDRIPKYTYYQGINEKG